MKPMKLIWGVVLVLAGGLFLAQNFNLISITSLQVWALIFAGLSLIFFATYVVSGVHNWGWLFPAFIMAGLAATMYLVENNVQGEVIGSIFLWSTAIPFLVPFALSPRKNWWALIPAWILGVLGAIVFTVNRMPGQVIAIVILLAFAIPFILVFLLDRRQWWALIPAYVFFLPAIIVIVTTARLDMIASLILLLIALPFFIVYIFFRNNWWALIPGGILGSVAISLLFIGVEGSTALKAALITGVMFLGFAITFGILWLQRKQHFTAWAKFPAVGCAIVAVMAFTSTIQFLWPLVLIGIGIWMITGFRGLRSASR